MIMRFFLGVCLAAAAIATPINHNTNTKLQGRAFSIAQVTNAKYDNTETGLDARLYAYVKYNAALPETLQVALEIGEHVNARYKALIGRGLNGTRLPSGQTGQVLAFPPRGLDIQYVVPVQVGYPEQTVFLNLDTGSGDLWTFSTETPQSQVQNQVLYNPDASNTSQLQEGQTWDIRYGDGSGASGIIYTDRVSIGVTSFAQQAVETATRVSGAFTRDSFSSGILGLGFGRGNTAAPRQVRTYVENILPTLALPLFTSNLLAGRPGNYNFGYISPREHEGAIAYTNVSRQNAYWEISVDGVQVGRQGTFRPAAELLKRVVVDTGTTLILVPDELVEEYYKDVRGARFAESWGGFVFPCASALPDWYFGIGTYRGRVPGEYVRYNQVNDTHCFGGIQSSEGIGFNLFGATLLKAQLAVFDYVDIDGRATPRVGFANKRLLRFD